MCKRSILSNKLLSLTLFLFALFAGVVNAQEASSERTHKSAEFPDTVSVSSREYNRFVLPNPFYKIIFPPKSPVRGKPIPLAGNTSFLIQFKNKPGATVQMVVQMKNGAVRTARLKIEDIPGITYRFDGAVDRLLSSGNHKSDTVSRSFLVDTMKSFTSRIGTIPEGFSVVSAPPTVLFETFTAKPIGAWSNGILRVYAFKLIAEPDTETVIAPPQFYRKGVLAVETIGDVVSNKESPMLYLIVDESVWTQE